MAGKDAGAGGASCGAAHARRGVMAIPRAISNVAQAASDAIVLVLILVLVSGLILVQSIDCQSAEKFGIEVGGLLRHHFARKGDFPDLVQSDGVEDESDLCISA